VRAGGPREGSGGAEASAVRDVAAQDATNSGGKERLMLTCAARGGAFMMTHSGQSMVWTEAVASPSPSATSLTAPALEHTSSITLGLTAGDAMATPSDNTNHTSTRRVICVERRKVCMPKILSSHPNAKSEIHQSFKACSSNHLRKIKVFTFNY
jgi:hypothetical protein